MDVELQEQCIICHEHDDLQRYNSRFNCDCNIWFHQECFNNMIQNRQTCPLCNKSLVVMCSCITFQRAVFFFGIWELTLSLASVVWSAIQEVPFTFKNSVIMFSMIVMGIIGIKIGLAKWDEVPIKALLLSYLFYCMNVSYISTALIYFETDQTVDWFMLVAFFSNVIVSAFTLLWVFIKY